MSLAAMSLSGVQRKALEDATRTYEAQLTEEALSYLLDVRGLDDATVTSARLGFVAEPEAGHERFVGMLSLPYVTPSGVVAIKFRRLDDGKPKYDAPAGQKPRLYNVRDLGSRSPDIAICEGELDALVLSGMVGIPAVGLPGTATWADHHPRCFADFERVLIVCDNDDKEDGSNPGQAFAARIAKTLPQAAVRQPPPGLDVNEWFLQEGADTIRETLLR